jgi:ABC-type multidrug transport system fused ATPase/permease subunit
MGETNDAPPIVRRHLLAWVGLRANRKRQYLLLVIVMVAAGVRLVPLEMQKRIVDEGILGKDVQRLTLYCAVYLLAFLTAAGLKYAINALQTVIGQHTLARMRRDMFTHIIHLPFGFFRNTQSGAVIATLMNELATAGDFIGLAIAVPAINLLTLAAFGVYLFLLNPLLAGVSFGIYPIVVTAIPFLQKRVNRYNRQRVNATRRLSGRIGEVIGGLHEIKACNAYRREEERYDRLVGRLRRIRIVWNLYRLAVKSANNLLVHFSRFLIFALGGYLALKGELAIGSLVAFISAQEKLYDPWKEMIQYYQAYQTAIVTYRRAMQTYDAMAEEHETADKSETPPLEGEVRIEDVGYRTAGGTALLESVSLEIPSGSHLALVGPSGSGKSTLVHCLVGLMRPSEGRIRIGGRDIRELSRADLSRNVAFVPQDPFVFSGSLAANLFYPEGRAVPDGAICEPGRRQDAIEVIQQVGLFVDVLGFGLENDLGEADCDTLREAILAVRRRLADALDSDLAAQVERFERDRFLHHASLGENVLFGRVRDRHAFGRRHLATHPQIADLLAEKRLQAPLVDLGLSILAELAPHLRRPPLPEDTQRLVPLTTKQIRLALDLVGDEGLKAGAVDLSPAQQNIVLTVALACIPSKVPRIVIPEALQDTIVASRDAIRERLEQQAPEAISFYRPEGYIEGADVLTNILFGRSTAVRKVDRRRLQEAINRALIEKELLEAIIGIGLRHQVGRSGKNLSGGQRQKLAIARALLKGPPVLVFDEATASLDKRSQARIQEILVEHWKGRSTLVAVIHRLDILPHYDQVAVMQDGRIVESGTPEDLLDRKDGALQQLAMEGTPSQER